MVSSLVLPAVDINFIFRTLVSTSRGNWEGSIFSLAKVTPALTELCKQDSVSSLGIVMKFIALWPFMVPERVKTVHVNSENIRVLWCQNHLWERWTSKPEEGLETLQDRPKEWLEGAGMGNMNNSGHGFQAYLTPRIICRYSTYLISLWGLGTLGPYQP